MKCFVTVKPKREDATNGKLSHYEYPPSKGVQIQIAAYNRTLGDFIKEQLWLIEGTDEQVANFKESSNVAEVQDWETANKLSAEWNPPVEIVNDQKAVMVAVKNLVEDLKKENKPIPSALDPDDPAVGITRKNFNLLDHVGRGEVK